MKPEKAFDLTEVQAYFAENPPPNITLKIGSTTIYNLNHFVNSHIQYCIHNNNKTYKPYYDRLIALKKYLTKNPIKP